MASGKHAPPQKKRRVGLWIFLGILLLLIASAAALVIWQWNTIEALIQYRGYTQEDIEKELADNDKLIEDTANNLLKDNVRPPTDEEIAGLKDGTITEDELVDKLTGGDKPASGTESDNTGENSGETEKPPETGGDGLTEQQKEDEYARKLADLIARVYVLREQYLIALDAMERTAIADYNAMPDRQRSVVLKFVRDYLYKASALERECDAQMLALCDEIEALDKEYGKDSNLADTALKAYTKEKSLKKASYMARLEKRGWI